MTTAETHIRAFDSTLQTTHRWLQELELAASLDNEAEAYSNSARRCSSRVFRRAFSCTDTLAVIRHYLPTSGHYAIGGKPQPNRIQKLPDKNIRIFPIADSLQAHQAVFNIDYSSQAAAYPQVRTHCSGDMFTVSLKMAFTTVTALPNTRLHSLPVWPVSF